MHINDLSTTTYHIMFFWFSYNINRLKSNRDSGKRHHPIYPHLCREAETWVWLSRTVDRGRRCPFKIWHSPIVLGMKDTVLSLGLWQCQAQLSSLSRERSTLKAAPKL